TSNLLDLMEAGSEAGMRPAHSMTSCSRHIFKGELKVAGAQGCGICLGDCWGSRRSESQQPRWVRPRRSSSYGLPRSYRVTASNRTSFDPLDGDLYFVRSSHNSPTGASDPDCA